MIRGAKFWVSMAVFQIVFGLAIFAITREHYMIDTNSVRENPAAMRQPGSEWSDQISDLKPALLDSLTSNPPTSKDPFEVSRQANEYFANEQYSMAVNLYEQLIRLDPNSVDAYNNLGLTLHYLGRSDEAIQRLTEGVALDPKYQRIWLTLGFVNSQLGNIGPARAALTTATEIDANSSVGQSAARMLDELQ